jgi:ubiquilin
MAEDMSISNEITITIKCSNSDKADISTENSISVAELKTIIEGKLKLPADQQRLIYRGRVLNDEFSLEHYEIITGSVLHLVKGVSKKPKEPEASAPPAATNTGNSGTGAGTQVPAANPFAAMFGNPGAGNPAANPFGGLAGLGGMGGMGGGAGDFNFAAMQENLMRNPEMMQNIMNSPMMENLMNNPDMMRSMMVNNPQMQAMLDANPHIRHVLNDPSVRTVICECFVF